MDFPNRLDGQTRARGGAFCDGWPPPPMTDVGEYVERSSRSPVSVEVVVGGFGALLLVGALAANQGWFDRHFLPVFFLSHDYYVLGEKLARTFVAAIGIALMLFVRPMAGRVAKQASTREFLAGVMRILLAVVLALTVSELVMRRTFALAAAEGPTNEEPLRRADPILGWSFIPSRIGGAIVAGRNVTYVIDDHGYRTRSRDTPVDFNQPTIIFTGESIMAGFGLNWEESIPAQVGSLTRVQSADIAVFGYANDQAYLRLKAELPRFHKPLAVISLFIPSLFVRNLDDDRPHLGSQLSWQPGVHRWRLHALVNFLIPYHSEAEIEHGIEATRAVLLASANLARTRHAEPLVVVPQFGPEGPVEGMIRRRILDQPGIAYVQVRLDPSWRLKGDSHPDPRAARAIAAAIAKHIQQR
jgi:hypothetical protein